MYASTVWLLVMLGAGTLLAFANVQYQIAKDREKREIVTQRIIELVRPELERNLRVLREKKKALEKSEPHVTVVTFDTTGWETVADSTLTGDIASEQLSRLLQAYHLMKRANQTQNYIMETIVGIGSTVRGKPHEEGKDRLLQLPRSTITELEPIIVSLLRTWPPSKADNHH